MPESRLTPLFVFGTLMITAFTVGAIIFLIIQKQRQIRNRLERQKLEFDYKQSLLQTRIEVQETTLSMLSQELHDNVNQMLTAAVMQLSAAGAYVPHGPGTMLLEEIRSNIKTVISDVRLLSHSLATGLVEQRDLAEAIQAELNRLQAFSGISCTLTSNTVFELQPEQRLLTFRIVQEALQNVLKHAKAQVISISIDAADDKYKLSIEDDGSGFDVEKASIGQSLGLLNMSDRARILNATMKIISTPLQGTKISVVIPISFPNE